MFKKYSIVILNCFTFFICCALHPCIAILSTLFIFITAVSEKILADFQVQHNGLSMKKVIRNAVIYESATLCGLLIGILLRTYF